MSFDKQKHELERGLQLVFDEELGFKKQERAQRKSHKEKWLPTLWQKKAPRERGGKEVI